MTRCPSCGQSPAASYLGLVFDWKARTIARDGGRPVRLPASQLMILDALGQGRGEAVSEAALLAAYRAGTATCARLMSKKVSTIRRAIAPLGLRIEIVRCKGYRLVETEAA